MRNFKCDKVAGLFINFVVFSSMRLRIIAVLTPFTLISTLGIKLCLILLEIKLDIFVYAFPSPMIWKLNKIWSLCFFILRLADLKSRKCALTG